MLKRRAQTDRQSNVTDGGLAGACAPTDRSAEKGCPAPRSTPRTSGRALAAREAVLLLVIVAAGLALLAGGSEAARDRLRQDLASRQLAMLREALAVYYLDTGTFPPGQPDLSAGEAFNILRVLPSRSAALADWPSASSSPDAEPKDPWRFRYHYLAHDNDRSQQVAGNGGWPLFASGGPDNDFGGGANPSAEVDNRGTDELLAE